MKAFVAAASILMSFTAAHAAKTCSQLVAECVKYNKAHNADTKRCESYRSPCMATGTYQDRNRTIINVIQR